MKRNNALPNNHFKKTAKKIKTWFGQAAAAVRRRENREAKAKKSFPNPINKLRPVVRCETIRYNKKERLGRGFTVEECKAAGLDYKYARTIGIAVDLRRTSANLESFEQNVQRLKEYQSKITIYDSRGAAREVKAVSFKGKIMPIEKKAIVIPTIKSSEIASFN